MQVTQTPFKIVRNRNNFDGKIFLIEIVGGYFETIERNFSLRLAA